MIVFLDRAVLVGLALGLACYVLPFWREGRLRWAFWLTLVATVAHIYTSHRRGAAAPVDPVADRAGSGPAHGGPGSA